MAKDGKRFFVSIPNEVLYDDLYPQAYRIAALISNMSHKDGFIWMENDWLAEKFNISVRTVTRSVSQLVEKGHYSRHVDRNDNNKRYLSPLSLGALKTLVMIAKHPGSIDKSVHTTDGDDRGASIDKSVQAPGQNCLPSLDKSGVSIKEGMYNEDVEREAPPLFDFLNPQKKHGKIYLEAKEKHFLLETPGFFGWFEEEVLKRFPKFNYGNLNNTTLADWDKKVFAVFGDEITTAAVCEMVGKTKGNIPSFAEVVPKARTIKTRTEAAKATKQREANIQVRQNEGPGDGYKSLGEMTPGELKAELKKQEDGEQTNTTRFVILRIRTKLAQQKAAGEIAAVL